MEKSRSKHLVIGMGEVGKAIFAVLKDKYEVHGIDRVVEESPGSEFDILHICIPWSDKFIEQVLAYKIGYLKLNGLTIIHSSVPIGTTAHIADAVHSPVRGVHPHLEEGIRTFVKYFGGPRAEEATSYFTELGITCHASPKSETTEALKLLDTSYYGVIIRFLQEAAEICSKYGLDLGVVYGHANYSYNEGYTELGMPQVVRPVLTYMPGKIGGHCVRENAKLLGGSLERFIMEKNED